jgi:plastocyanin
MVTAGLLLTAACGSSSDTTSSSSSSPSSSRAGAGNTVELSEFKITPSGITVQSGSTLNVTNQGTVAHDLVVQDATGRTLVKTTLIQPGQSASLSLSGVSAGSYTVVCDVAGHKESGMKGTLTVS